MAKRRLTGSFSYLLYTIGDAIRFAPSSEFAPPQSEKEEVERMKPFPAARLKIKNALAKMCEQSFFLGLYAAFLRGFFTTRVRAFGVLFFSCGFLQILSYFLGGYLPVLAGDESNLVFGVTLIFLALLCAFTRGDVKDVLKKSFLYRGVLEPLFGSETWRFPAGRSGDKPLLMILMGVIFAFFAVLFTPFAVLSVIFLAVLILFVFYQPEAGLTAIALALFSVPFTVTAFLTVLTTLAFFCKCAVGKRSIVFSFRDGAVLLCLIPLLFSEKSRTLCIVLCVLYLLSLGLLRTLSSIRRVLCALTLGGVFCAAMIFARYVVTTFFAELLFRYPNLEELLFLDVSPQTVAPIAMACPLAMGVLRSAKNSAGLFLSVPILAVFFAAVFSGASPAIWIALLFALSLQNVMTHRLALVWYAILGFLSVIALNVMPSDRLKSLFDLLNFSGSEKFGGAAELSVFGLGNVVGFLILAGLFACFLYATASFVKIATGSKVFSRVLGAIGGTVAFVVLSLCGVAPDERTVVLFILTLSLPRVSLLCAKREEIRLPY